MARRPLGILVHLGLWGLLTAADAGPAPKAETSASFIARHWRLPLAGQGAPPATFGPSEVSLHPEKCGACHPAQYADWATSAHAESLGPGVSGQLRELHRHEPAKALTCYTCHAPLAEQRPGAAEYDPTLTPKGIVCAACHVRAWQRFGPPRRDGSLVSATPREQLAHNGVTRTEAFLRAEFCRDCHQFPPGGLALEGKLLQNTYEEWRASPAAAAGVQCQDCHMSDRRHRWRGIHDADMVRSALAFEVASAGDVATLSITNAGAGHFVPTYVTPRLVISGELVDGAGRALPGSRTEAVIGRQVSLDLTRERFDTRLAPGQTAQFRVTFAGESARAVRFRVRVEPDHFYTEFFAALLEQGAGAGEPEIRAALDASRRSAFLVYERDVARQ
jgi:Cytochrome c554 and c-prime